MRSLSLPPARKRTAFVDSNVPLVPSCDKLILLFVLTLLRLKTRTPPPLASMSNVVPDAGIVPIPTRPSDVMRSLSVPPVSAVIVSAEGNLIAVFVSPV